MPGAPMSVSASWPSFPCSAILIFRKNVSPAWNRPESGPYRSFRSSWRKIPAFDELKAGLLNVLGNVECRQSFEILAKFTEHENRYIVTWASEALARHKNPEALPYLEKAQERLGALSKIAGAIKEIAELTR